MRTLALKKKTDSIFYILQNRICRLKEEIIELQDSILVLKIHKNWNNYKKKHQPFSLK
jgi:hypothetical protein